MKFKRFFLTFCVALFLFVGCRSSTDALFPGGASPSGQPAAGSPPAEPAAQSAATSEDLKCAPIIKEVIDSPQFQLQVGGYDAALAEFAQRQLVEQLGILNFLGKEADWDSKAEYHQESLCLSRKRLELSQQLKDPTQKQRQSLMALYGVSSGYRAIGDAASALSWFNQYLQLAQDTGNQRAEAVALGSIGELYQELGDYDRALQYHQQRLGVAYKVLRFNDDPSKPLNVSPDVATYPSESTPVLSSLTALPDRDAEGFDSYTGRQLVSDALGSIGDNYFIQNNCAEAIKYYEARYEEIEKLLAETAIEPLIDTGLQASWIATLTSLAKAYAEIKEFSKAEEKYSQVQEFIDKNGTDSGLGQSAAAAGFYESRIEFLLSQKRLDEALRFADQFIQRYQSVEDPEQQKRLKQIRAFSEARYYCRSYSDQDMPGICRNGSPMIEYSNLFDEVQSGRAPLAKLVSVLAALPNDTKDELDRACTQIDCDTVKFSKNDQGLGRVYNLAGLAYFQKDDLPAATDKFNATIELREKLLNQRLSDTLKVFFFDTQRNAYLNLQQTLIKQKEIEKALVTSEKGRAQVFAEMLGANRTANTPANPEANTSPAVNPNVCSGEMSIELIRCVAREHQLTLVEYSLIEQPITDDLPELLIWVVKPTGEVEFRSQQIGALRVNSAQPANWIYEARSRIGLSDSDGKNQRAATVIKAGRTADDAATASAIPFSSAEQTRTLQDLHALLIQPIADLLPKTPSDRVLLVPDGGLFLIPFAALQDKTEQFLLDSHTLLTAPSIQVLNQIYSRPSSKNRLFSSPLIVGNPESPSLNCQGGDIDLAPLHGAESEAKDVANLLQTQPLIRGQATESTVRQKINSAGLIHLAAHGLLDNCPGYAVPGAIALTADGETESANGWLTASEIADLKLTANLAVLSSCNTGQGRLTGDGVMGLSRSFLKTVPSVILSLWSVGDDSTAELMKQFYEKLRGMGSSPDKAVALRNAMLATKANRDYDDPRQWAAFSLMGIAE